jgi:hypothetical protein
LSDKEIETGTDTGSSDVTGYVNPGGVLHKIFSYSNISAGTTT